jgi:hypothetical protein
MSLDSSYDMILLPPPRDSDNGGGQPTRWRRNRRRLSRMGEGQLSSSPHPLPRHRRRRKRGNQGRAGGCAPTVVEQTDIPGAPTEDAPSVALAFEAKASSIPPQHDDPKQVDDASTLTEGLQDVALVPKTAARSTLDVASSLLVDKKVPTAPHLSLFRLDLNTPGDLALAGTHIEASATSLGFRVRSPWDRLTGVSTYGPSGSEEDDDPSICWDFSGSGNPSAMRGFMTACDYCLSDCSDGSRSLGDKDCGPSRECFHIELGDPSGGGCLGMPEDGDLPRPAPRADILRELAVVPVPAGGHDPQLEQVRGAQAGLDEGAGALEAIRQNIGQVWAGQPPAGEIRHLPQGLQHRTTNDARARLPPASGGTGQDLAAAAMLLRAMPESSTTEGRRIQGELKHLLEGAAARRAESSASRRQGYPSDPRATTSRLTREASVFTGRTRNTAPAAPGHLGDEHPHRDRRARLDERVRRGYHPRRGGRYDSGEDRSPSPEPPGPQVFSRAIRRAPFPPRF